MHTGTLLASGSDDLSVILWNWIKKRPSLVYDSGHRGNVFQVLLTYFLYIKSKARFSKFEIFMLNKGMRRNFLIYCNSLFILHKNLNFSIKIQCYVHVQTGNCVIQYSCVVVLDFFSFITGQIYALQW